ncbi:FkbM family methyltransferase [Humibacter sp.]|uniref:FkbM family methyltransferase n=1 Tax=Humibacter sp. TaxID=1940291 RepID=UPI002D0B28FD|nr:FkbM family methyltransferase [Humibacter sp.]HVX07921.1 FkbM family methyltransferase [Humibacter sp.]
MVDVLSFCVDKHGWVADVGANVGLITLPLARRIAHRGGGVVAFEPIERNAARLRASAALNEVRVEMHVLALGEEDDDVTIWLDRQLGAATGNARIGQRQRPDEEPVTCAVRRLDDLRIRPVDALKVDVEGTEVAFLRGAQRYLATHRPVILGEFNSELMPLQNTDFTDVPPLLPDGYRIAAFVAQGVVEVAAKKGLGDVLLVPEERWPAVIERVNSASDVAFGQEGPGTD